MRNYSAFYLFIWTFNFLTFATNNNKSIWSNCMLIMINCHKMWLVVFGFAINVCYCFHKSDFDKSDWSQKQFILLMNCIIGSLALLLKLAIVLTDLTFIGLISAQGNLRHLWIARLVLSFIWVLIQSWLLDHLALSLDLSTIL